MNVFKPYMSISSIMSFDIHYIEKFDHPGKCQGDQLYRKNLVTLEKCQGDHLVTLGLSQGDHFVTLASISKRNTEFSAHTGGGQKIKPTPRKKCLNIEGFS